MATTLRSRLPDIVAADHVAFQCTYFEKSQASNWLVALHQDLSIPVLEKIPHPALRGWSQKDGELHVQAPDVLLEQLVAIRLHLDDCDANNGALSVVPGSHALGRLRAADALAARERCGTLLCPVARGGVMALRPLLLHASSKASGSQRRRVLHFVFGPRELPFGLRWARAV